ncbi:MAG: hypothetical protein J7J67_01935 [Thermoproteales archaeon]|nr:hypothetical protein [Thermoproteales archaeon]
MLSSRDWREGLRNLRNLAKLLGEPRYRFGLPYVKISDLAEQYYCEAKVDAEHRFGAVSTEEKEEGTLIHDELLKMKPATLEELIRNIEKKPICWCSFPVYAELEGLLLVGVPDAVVFKNSKPALLIELKTTAGSLSKLWSDEKVQAETYAYALDYIGFDCSNLNIVVAKSQEVQRQGSSSPGSTPISYSNPFKKRRP